MNKTVAKAGPLACPKCGGRTRVVDCRPTGNALRRRRECLACGFRKTSREAYL